MASFCSMRLFIELSVFHLVASLLPLSFCSYVHGLMRYNQLSFFVLSLLLSCFQKLKSLILLILFCMSLLNLFCIFIEYVSLCSWCLAGRFLSPWNLPGEKYWSGLPFPSPGDLPNPGIEPVSLISPALAGGFFTTSAPWKVHGEHEPSQRSLLISPEK